MNTIHFHMRTEHTLHRSTILIPFIVALLFFIDVFPVHAKEECTTQYAACMDEANTLPGSVYDTDSAFYKAWAACSQANSLCEFGPTETAPSKDDTLTGELVKMTGDVEVSTDNGKTYTPATAGMQLKKGDRVSTGGTSSAQIHFGYGDLQIWSATLLRIDEFVNQKNLKKSQLYLNVGTIRIAVKKPANIRTDFSVQTNTATASIRGSEMAVRYNKKKGTTQIYAVSGRTYWKRKGAKKASVLSANTKVTISASGRASKPVAFSPSELAQ